MAALQVAILQTLHSLPFLLCTYKPLPQQTLPQQTRRRSIGAVTHEKGRAGQRVTHEKGRAGQMVTHEKGRSGRMVTHEKGRAGQMLTHEKGRAGRMVTDEKGRAGRMVTHEKGRAGRMVTHEKGRAGRMVTHEKGRAGQITNAREQAQARHRRHHLQSWCWLVREVLEMHSATTSLAGLDWDYHPKLLEPLQIN